MAVNDPVVLVVIVLGIVDRVTPSKDIVTVELPANPVPVTFTVAPTGPLAGVNVIDGIVTEKTALAELALASVAVTV